MRELKFRLWDDNTKRWVSRGESVEIAFSQSFPESIKAEANFYLEQYTGLTDKNGKEIYEGDIVKFDCGDQTPAEVVYQAGSYFLRATDDGSLFYDPEAGKPCPLGWFETWGLEVIGNIHENPELMLANK